MKKLIPFTLLLSILFVAASCKKSCGLAPNATELYKKGNKCFYYTENEQGEKEKVSYPCANCIH